MYESLNLPKAKLKIRGFVLLGILSIALLIVPCYYLLRPLYVHIDNPYFIIGFTALAIVTIGALEIFNRSRLQQMVNDFDRSSFVFNLQPAELVYLKTQDLSQVINGIVNELVENDTIRVNKDGTIDLRISGNTHSLNKYRLQPP